MEESSTSFVDDKHPAGCSPSDKATKISFSMCVITTSGNDILWFLFSTCFSYFLPFFSLRSLQVSNSFCLLLLFLIVLLIFQIPPNGIIASSVFSPPFSLHFLDVCSHCKFFISHCFLPMSTYSSPISF